MIRPLSLSLLVINGPVDALGLMRGRNYLGHESILVPQLMQMTELCGGLIHALIAHTERETETDKGRGRERK